MVDTKPVQKEEVKIPTRKKRWFYSADLGRSVLAHDNQEAKDIVNKKLK